jgi:hypothetical protein
MPPDDEIAERAKDRKTQQEERQRDRQFQQAERRNDRRFTLFMAVITGVIGLVGGGLGSQAINKLTHSELKKPTYTIQTTASGVDSNLNTTILKFNPDTGETWYSRKKGRNDILEWVRINDQSIDPVKNESNPQRTK